MRLASSAGGGGVAGFLGGGEGLLGGSTSIGDVSSLASDRFTPSKTLRIVNVLGSFNFSLKREHFVYL